MASEVEELVEELTDRAMWDRLDRVDHAFIAWIMAPWYRRLWEWLRG